MADEISSIGVKLSLNATDFMAGMGAATTATTDFVAAAKEASTVAGPAGTGRKSGPRSSAAQSVGVPLDLSISPAQITKLREQIIKGIGTIPITVTPQISKGAGAQAEAVVAAQVTPVVGTRSGAAHSVRSNVKQNLPQRQYGGPVAAGQGVIVGERRAEVFTPRQSGYIHADAERFYREQERLEREHQRRMRRMAGGPAEPMGPLQRRIAGLPPLEQPRPAPPQPQQTEPAWVRWTRENRAGKDLTRRQDGGPTRRAPRPGERGFRWPETFSSSRDRVEDEAYWRHVQEEATRQRREKTERLREERNARWFSSPVRESRSRIDKLRSMADQEVSPNEAAIARRMLRDRGIPGYRGGGYVRRQGGGPTVADMLASGRAHASGISPRDPGFGAARDWYTIADAQIQGDLRDFNYRDTGLGYDAYAAASAGQRWPRNRAVIRRILRTGQKVPRSAFTEDVPGYSPVQVTPSRGYGFLDEAADRLLTGRTGGLSGVKRAPFRAALEGVEPPWPPLDSRMAQIFGAGSKAPEAGGPNSLLGRMRSAFDELWEEYKGPWGLKNKSQFQSILWSYFGEGPDLGSDWATTKSGISIPRHPGLIVPYHRRRGGIARAQHGMRFTDTSPGVRGRLMEFLQQAYPQAYLENLDAASLRNLTSLANVSGMLKERYPKTTGSLEGLSLLMPGEFPGFGGLLEFGAGELGQTEHSARTFRNGLVVPGGNSRISLHRGLLQSDQAFEYLNSLTESGHFAAIRSPGELLLHEAMHALDAKNELYGSVAMQALADIPSPSRYAGDKPPEKFAEWGTLFHSLREKDRARVPSDIRELFGRLEGRQGGGFVENLFHAVGRGVGFLDETMGTAAGWARDPFMAYMAWQGQQQAKQSKRGSVVRDVVGKPRLARDFAGSPMAMGIPPSLFHQIGPQGLAGAVWQDAMRRQDPMAYLRLAPDSIDWGEVPAPGATPNLWWTLPLEQQQEAAQRMTLGLLGRKKIRHAVKGMWLPDAKKADIERAAPTKVVGATRIKDDTFGGMRVFSSVANTSVEEAELERKLLKIENIAARHSMDDPMGRGERLLELGDEIEQKLNAMRDAQTSPFEAARPAPKGGREYPWKTSDFYDADGKPVDRERTHLFEYEGEYSGALHTTCKHCGYLEGGNHGFEPLLPGVEVPPLADQYAARRARDEARRERAKTGGELARTMTTAVAVGELKKTKAEATAVAKQVADLTGRTVKVRRGATGEHYYAVEHIPPGEEPTRLPEVAAQDEAPKPEPDKVEATRSLSATVKGNREARRLLAERLTELEVQPLEMGKASGKRHEAIKAVFKEARSLHEIGAQERARRLLQPWAEAELNDENAKRAARGALPLSIEDVGFDPDNVMFHAAEPEDMARFRIREGKKKGGGPSTGSNLEIDLRPWESILDEGGSWRWLGENDPEKVLKYQRKRLATWRRRHADDPMEQAWIDRQVAEAKHVIAKYEALQKRIATGDLEWKGAAALPSKEAILPELERAEAHLQEYLDLHAKQGGLETHIKEYRREAEVMRALWAKAGGEPRPELGAVPKATRKRASTVGKLEAGKAVSDIPESPFPDRYDPLHYPDGTLYAEFRVGKAPKNVTIGKGDGSGFVVTHRYGGSGDFEPWGMGSSWFETREEAQAEAAKFSASWRERHGWPPVRSSTLHPEPFSPEHDAALEAQRNEPPLTEAEKNAARERFTTYRERTVPQHQPPEVIAHAKIADEALARRAEREAEHERVVAEARAAQPEEPAISYGPHAGGYPPSAEEILERRMADLRRHQRQDLMKRAEGLGLFTVTRRTRAAGGGVGEGLYIVNEAGPEAFLTARDADKLARVRPDIIARVPGASDGARTGMIQKPAWSLFAPQQQGLIVRREDAIAALHAVRAEDGMNIPYDQRRVGTGVLLTAAGLPMQPGPGPHIVPATTVPGGLHRVATPGPDAYTRAEEAAAQAAQAAAAADQRRAAASDLVTAALKRMAANAAPASTPTPGPDIEALRQRAGDLSEKAEGLIGTRPKAKWSQAMKNAFNEATAARKEAADAIAAKKKADDVAAAMPGLMAKYGATPAARPELIRGPREGFTPEGPLLRFTGQYQPGTIQTRGPLQVPERPQLVAATAGILGPNGQPIGREIPLKAGPPGRLPPMAGPQLPREGAGAAEPDKKWTMTTDELREYLEQGLDAPAGLSDVERQALRFGYVKAKHQRAREGGPKAAEELLADVRLGTAGSAAWMSARTPRGVAAVYGEMFGGGAEFKRKQARLQDEQSKYRRVGGEYDFWAAEVEAKKAGVEEARRIAPDVEPVKLIEQLQDAETTLGKVRQRLTDQSEKLVTAEEAVMPTTGGILKSFGSIILATSAYGAAFSMANMVLEKALLPAMGKLGDQFLGFAPTMTRFTSALADSTREMGGNYKAALAAKGMTAGLSSETYAWAESALGATTIAKAGAKTYADFSEILRASIGALNQEGMPQGLGGGYGGILGSPLFAEQLGGGKGLQEQMLGDILAARGQTGIDLSKYLTMFGAGFGIGTLGGGGVNVGTGLLAGGAAAGASVIADIATGNFGNATGPLPERVEPGSAEAVLGESLKAAMERAQGRGGGPQYRFAYQGRDVSAEYANAPKSMQNLAKAGYAVVDSSDRIVTAFNQVVAASEQLAEGLTIPDVKTWAQTVERQINAQFQAMDIASVVNRGITIPLGFAMQRITTPLLAPGTGVVPGAGMEEVYGRHPDWEKLLGIPAMKPSQYAGFFGGAPSVEFGKGGAATFGGGMGLSPGISKLLGQWAQDAEASQKRLAESDMAARKKAYAQILGQPDQAATIAVAEQAAVTPVVPPRLDTSKLRPAGTSTITGGSYAETLGLPTPAPRPAALPQPGLPGSLAAGGWVTPQAQPQQYGPPAPAGLQNARDYNTLMDAAQSASNQIKDLQTSIASLSAAAAQASWANTTRLALRSISDAAGMLGQAGGSTLGKLQRHLWQISRASQALDLALQQRQITTQIALAGFQAPGETGEERYMRQKEQLALASIQQRKLGYAKETYTGTGQEWQIQAQRNLEDAQAAWAAAQKAHTAEMAAADAQATIASLSAEIASNLAQADDIYQTAAGKFGITASSLADYAKTFGGTIKEANADLRGLGGTLGTAASGVRSFLGALGFTFTPNNRGGYTVGVPNLQAGGDHGNAAGIIGLSTGPTRPLLGEAGTEAVAILRNPRMGSFAPDGGGGGGMNLTVNVNGPVVRKDGDIAELARCVAAEVERTLSRKGQLLNLRSPAY